MARWEMASETAMKRSRLSMARDAIHSIPGDILPKSWMATTMLVRVLWPKPRPRMQVNRITVDAVIHPSISASAITSVNHGSNGKFVKYEIGSIRQRGDVENDSSITVRDGTVFAISTSNVSTRLFRIL